jgi:hypothetical protein
MLETSFTMLFSLFKIPHILYSEVAYDTHIELSSLNNEGREP